MKNKRLFLIVVVLVIFNIVLLLKFSVLRRHSLNGIEKLSTQIELNEKELELNQQNLRLTNKDIKNI